MEEHVFRNYKLCSAFDYISANLTEQEINLLQRFTRMEGNSTTLVDAFFLDLMQNQMLNLSVYQHNSWKYFESEEKKMLFQRIRSWYQIIMAIAPEYREKFDYTIEDEKKMEIILELDKMQSFDSQVKFLQLENIRAKRGEKIKLAEWIDGEIEERRGLQECGVANYPYIIPLDMIEKLYDEFCYMFPEETLDIWRRRFMPSPNYIERMIKVDDKMNDDNNRLFLVVLLSKLEGKKPEVKDFEEYVKLRWSDISYRVAKSRSNDYILDKETSSLLNTILKINSKIDKK